jgi:hypothetical protein
MSNYWSVDDVVQIGESKVSIPSENGLSYSGGQKISLFVPPSVKFMSGKDSYINCDVKIALPAGKLPTKLQLDEAGAGILIKNLRIYDGTRGNLIEEINEYSELVALKYDYDTDASKRNMRALTEGATNATISNRGSLETSHSMTADTITNPYFKPVTADSAVTWADANFTTAKCCIPIHSGVFSGAIFPVMMSNGLYLEFDLQPAPRVIKQLDSVLASRRTKLNPVFHACVTDAPAEQLFIDQNDTFDTIYIAKDNNLSGDDALARFPFCVGESFQFVLGTNAGSISETDVPMVILEINACTTGTYANYIEVKLDDDVTLSSATQIDNTYHLYSTSVCGTLVPDVAVTSYDATYTISNFNLIVHEVQLDPKYEAGMLQKAREGKAIEFDIHSVTNYKNSLLAADRQTSFLIHAQNSRAKSLLVCPCDSSIYTSAQLISASGTYEVTADDMDTLLNSNRSGYVGICDFLTSVQYQINGKLVPSRPVSTKKCATRASIDAFHIFECEKSLDNAGIVPRSFKKYLENWVLGRGFAVGKGAMDLRDKDLSVILKYEETTAPTKPKMINSFVFHVRRLIMRGSGAVDIVQ